MDIGSVLSRAWQIIWKHKILWIFGILASCTSANYGTSNLRNSIQYRGELSPQMQNAVNLIPGWEIALIVGIVILVILVLVILAIFLGTIGRIGLIRGTLQAEGGAATLEFGDLFNGSLPYFWRVFLLNLIVGLATALVFIILILAGTLGSIVTLGLGLLCFIPMLCLLVPLSWFINIVVEQADIAIVAENLGILAGLQRGWDVVKNNLGMIIVMGLILILGVGLIGGFIIGLPFAVIVAPAIFGVVAGTQQALQGGLLVAGLCLVAYLPVLILLNGILRGYIGSAWTLTFMQLVARPAPVQPAPVPPPAE